ncbi:hypothetical protein GN956_G24362 [Arapaima gigas]
MPQYIYEPGIGAAGAHGESGRGEKSTSETQKRRPPPTRSAAASHAHDVVRQAELLLQGREQHGGKDGKQEDERTEVEEETCKCRQETRSVRCSWRRFIAGQRQRR